MTADRVAHALVRNAACFPNIGNAARIRGADPGQTRADHLKGGALHATIWPDATKLELTDLDGIRSHAGGGLQLHTRLCSLSGHARCSVGRRASAKMTADRVAHALVRNAACFPNIGNAARIRGADPGQTPGRPPQGWCPPCYNLAGCDEAGTLRFGRDSQSRWWRSSATYPSLFAFRARAMFRGQTYSFSWQAGACWRPG